MAVWAAGEKTQRHTAALQQIVEIETGRVQGLNNDTLLVVSSYMVR